MTESKNFQMVYQINDVRKTIKLLTSFDFKNKKKFEVFKNLTVIRFNKDNAYAVLELQGTTSLRYFNFKTGKKYQTSILPSNPKEYIYQDIDYDCFISN